MRVLVVAAHPDDEILGCGATIARLSAEHDVDIVILGEGVTSRSPRREAAVRTDIERLQEQARAAAAVIGAGLVAFGGLPDNRFDELPLLDVVKRVERWLDERQPEVVYTHHPGDLNIDHGITARAVLTATRPVPGYHVREVYGFEVPSSTEWAFQRIEPAFRPNVFMDVAKTIELKIRALQHYTGEVRAFPHPRSPEALRAIAQRWGSVAGLEFAEAFELFRAIR
jgi:LmbE family N-acetylglucosaminyl deacetylase